MYELNYQQSSNPHHLPPTSSHQPLRKRQRRQAAALVVSSFFTMGKKSTAQPRPTLHVPPKGIGPISEPNPNDVLCGRGGRINAHDGNVQFREIVMAHKKVYLAKTTKKLEKAHIAARIVEQIRTMNPPGRFLKEDSATGMWWDIGDAKAIKKAGQALREDAPDIRDGSDDDCAATDAPKKASPKSASNKKTSTSKRPHTTTNTKEVPLAPPAPTPAMARGISWHSTGSSTFGMPFPNNSLTSQQLPSIPAATAFDGDSKTPSATFPSTASVGSNGVHSLSSGTAIVQNQLYSMPNQLYQGIRGAGKTAGALSKRAAEIMHMQQIPQQQQQHPGARSRRYLDDELFGRVFTPTEISSGSTISTMSGGGMSGISGYSSRSRGTTPSALSLGSFGGGGGHHAAIGNSLRMSQLSNAVHNRRGSSQARGVSNGLSDVTTSFMSTSGLTRSPSFGDLSSTTNNNMHTDSLTALLQEEQDASQAFLSSSAAAATMPAPPLRNNAAGSSAMSITSMGSDKSAMTYTTMKSVNSTNSWLQPYTQGQQQQQQASSSINRAPLDGIWDERSIMSDVSESISALDLAGCGSSIYSNSHAI